MLLLKLRFLLTTQKSETIGILSTANKEYMPHTEKYNISATSLECRSGGERLGEILVGY